MKNRKKFISKLLTIVLSTMMIFSSVLVVNTNVVLAEVSDEQTNEVAPETEDKAEPSEEEKIVEQTVDTEKDNTIINEGSDDTTSGDETNQNNEGTQQVGENVSEQSENNQQEIKEENKKLVEEEVEKPIVQEQTKIMMKSTAPKLGGILSGLRGLLTGTYSVTFKRGTKTLKPKNSFNYSSIKKEDGKNGIPTPTFDSQSGTLLGWYKRTYNILGMVTSEKKWHFKVDNGTTPDEVNSSITLYAKYINDDDFDKAFDFRVKHEGSNCIDINNNGVIDGEEENAKLEEFLESNTTGEYIKFEVDEIDNKGYLYSYYSYYKQDFNYGFITNIINDIQKAKDFNKAEVEEYSYVKSADQVISAVVLNTNSIDPENTGFIVNCDLNSDGTEDADEKDLIGKAYEVLDDKYECNFDSDDIVDTCVLISIGDYYKGTAFDLAIQEANKGDTIELLHSIYITKPIEIWANVNFDLHNKTIIFNENSLCLDVLHTKDRWFRKSDIITSKDICAAIYCNNAITKISNGYIYNFHPSGKGILSTAVEPSWITTIDNVEIHVPNGNNAIEAGAYSFNDVFSITGVMRGFINVLSGKIDGYVLNNGDGYLKLNGETDVDGNYSGVVLTKDPNIILGGSSSNVLISEGYQSWNDNSGEYKYYIDLCPEAKVSINGEEKQYKHLETAIYEYSNNKFDNNTIYLLKDRTQESNTGLPININGSLVLNFGKNKITGGYIVVQNGNLTLTGEGSVSGVKHEGGSLTILDGKYEALVYNVSNANNIYIAGGFYKEEIEDSVLGETETRNDYECIASDIQSYPFEVVLKENAIQADLTLNGEPVDSSEYPKLVQAINAINQGILEADTVTLRSNIVINDVITIRKPITLDLNNKEICSKVVDPNSGIEVLDPEEYPEIPLDEDFFDVEDVVVEFPGFICSVYVDIDESEDGEVVICNGKIVNKAEVEEDDTSTIYGIYNNKGIVELNKLNLVMDAKKCKELIGVYNSTDGECTVCNSSKINAIDNSTFGYEAASAQTIEFVVNDGIFELNYPSQINLACTSDCQTLVGINNSGELLINGNPNPVRNELGIITNGESKISLSGAGSISTDIYAIKNSGNIHMQGGSISATNNQGTTYGIYGENKSTLDDKSIVIEKGAIISIFKNSTSPNYTYGIYIAQPSTINKVKANPMNITLGKCDISVGSRNTAYGIYSAGGRIVSGTIDNETIDNVVFKSSALTIPDVASENNAAEIVINGGNNSIGIDNEFIDTTKTIKPSQLTNAYISMEIDPSYLIGNKIYCVQSNSSSIGIDLYDGYYSSVGNNGLLTSKVNAKGGYYSEYVTPAKNYKCTALDLTKHHENSSYNVKNDYFYQVTGDDCSMTVTIPDDAGAFEVIIKIKYDADMLKEPEKYGVEITSDVFDRPIIASIADSLKNVPSGTNVTSDYAFKYSFRMPAKMMGKKFSVYIVDFVNSVPNHIYHSVENYSAETYCYTVLKTTSTNNAYYYPTKARQLAAAMLNYATYAEIYFNRDISPNEYSNRNLGDYFTDSNRKTKFSKIVEYDSSVEDFRNSTNDDNYSGLFKAFAHSLLFDSEYGLEYEFELIDSLNINDLEFRCNGDIIKPVARGSNLFYIDIKNIATKELKNEYTFEVSYENEEGEKVILSSNYAPLEYIIDAYNYEGSETQLKDLLNSLYKYYLIVKNFKIS